MYCIVDLETTGGSASRSRITEIAVFKTDGQKILDSYTSLINPNRPIPPHISRLTGITDEMVAQAPLFHQVADKIEEFTKDSIFIAHNVNFDYNFLRHEYQRIGRSFRRKKLCTVRLSRQIIKSQPSYSLGKLCASLEIPLQNRHRAFGDAEATTQLFHLLLEKDKNEVIANSLKPQSLEALLPPHLPKSDFLALPEEQGLYYFKDARSKIVYIGQAKNIKQRVHSHFSGNSNSRSKYYFTEHIYSVDFQLVPNPMLLDLKEAIEIKKFWPRHNRSLKRFSLNYGVFSYQDQKGYERLAIGRCGKYERPLKSFRSREEAFQLVKDMVYEFELCPRLSGLQPLSSGACNYVEEINCKGACHEEESSVAYNKRLQKAISKMLKDKSSFWVEERTADQKAIVLVENGRLKGFASVPASTKVKDIHDAREMLSATYDDQDLSAILNKHLQRSSATKEVHYF